MILKKFWSLLLVMLTASLSQFTFAQGQLWGVTPEGGVGEGGVIFKINADGSSYISAQAQLGFDVPGRTPQSMVMGNDGKFYGTMTYGGAYDGGVLFRYDSITGQYTALHHFEQSKGYWPTRGIMRASNGKLYGTTSYGGLGNLGVIYEFDTNTGVYSVVYSFASPSGNQSRSGLIEADNGKLYGTTSAGGNNSAGTLYEFDRDVKAVVIRHHFSTATGSAPSGPVMQASDGKLYGMTSEGGANSVGVLYSFELATWTYTKHADLSQAIGRTPYGGLTESSGTHKLFGLTFYGGASGEGAIIKFDPVTSSLVTAVSLGPASNIPGRPSGSFTEAPNGKFYCVTFDALVSFNPVNNAVTLIRSFPGDGTGGGGSVTGTFKGKLFGLSPTPLSITRGSIFSYDLDDNTFTTKINFNKSQQGAIPAGSLVKATNGKLYGMTSQGGVNDVGVIFEIDPATGAYSKKIDLTAANGSKPSGGMVLGSDGKLYGMTTYGGSDDFGVLFQYDPSTNTYTKKKDFTLATGKNPLGDLVLASNGKFYGMAPSGYYTPSGYLFEYDAALNALTVKISFTNDVNGSETNGTLTVGADGKLYGTTVLGGTNNGGVLFEYDPATNTYTKKIDFSHSNDFSESSIGNRPTGRLVLSADGKLYGMTLNGGYLLSNGSTGTLFEFNPTTGAITRKYRFGCASASCTENGYGPYGGLTIAANNKLYGTLNAGGAGDGTAFEFDPTTNTFKKKFNFTRLNGAKPKFGSLLFLPGISGQTITFDAILETTRNVSTITLSATATSGLPVSYTSSNPAVATVAGNTVTIVGAGTTTITASQAGNSDFTPAPNVERTLVVSKVVQTLSFSLSTSSKTFGDVPFSLNASATSGLSVSYSSSNESVATISGNVVTIKGAGTTTLYANQPGDDFFAPATQVSQTLTVSKASQAISFGLPLTTKFAQGSLVLTATSTAGLTVTYTSSDLSVATISGSTVTFLSRGTTQITAKQSGNANYTAATDAIRTLTIENSSPTALTSIPRQEAMQLLPFTFTFDNNVFSDPDNDAITFSATKQDGQPLPAWLTFSAITRTFSGTPGTTDRTIDVRLTATDAFNASTSINFQLAIAIITSAEIAQDNELDVYPNPAHDKLIVHYRAKGEHRRIAIRSLEGKLIYENTFEDNTAEVDASGWSAGYYLVEVITDNGTIRKRIIKS